MSSEYLCAQTNTTHGLCTLSRKSSCACEPIHLISKISTILHVEVFHKTMCFKDLHNSSIRWFQDIPLSKISQIFPVSKMHNFEFHNTLRSKISKILRIWNSSTILLFEVYHKISSLKISTIFCAKLFFFDHNTYNFSALPRGCLILFLPPFSRDPQCAPPPSRKMNAPLVGM